MGVLYLFGGFIWDDGPLIVDRLAGLDVVGMLALWTGPVTSEGPGASYFRPVALTLLSLLGRIGPWAIHLLTLVLHAVSAGLIVRECRGHRWPLIGGLVFALHPLGAEVLGWCSALPDALAVCLGLLAVRLRSLGGMVSLVLLVIGGFSKETALLIPLMFAIGRGEWRDWLGPWFGALGVIAAVRSLAGVGMGSAWVSKLSLAPSALGWATGALIWPFPQHAVRDLQVAPLGITVLGYLLLVGLLVVGRRSRLALAGAGLVLAAPTVALPVALDGYLLGERYSYPALVGLGVWLSAVLRPMGRSWMVWALMAAGLGVHAGQAKRFQTNISLFSSAEVGGRGSSYAWHLLGYAQMQNGDYGSAAGSFLAAVDGGTPYPNDRLLRMQALVLGGRPDEALQWAAMGPSDGLTAEDIAWRARANWASGNQAQARLLLGMLRGPNGFSGPHWVSGFAGEVFRAPEPSIKHDELETP